MLTRSRVQGAAGRPAVPAASDPSLKSCGVDQLSRPTQRRVRGAVGWNRSPGRLGPAPELTQEQPAIPALLVSVPSWGGVDQLSRPTQTRVRGALESQAVPADSVQIRTAAGSTSSSGRFAPGSQELWGGPALLADSVLGPNLHRVDHLSRSIWSQLRTDALSLIFQDDPVTGLRSCGVDQVSRLTRTRGRGAVGFTSYPGQLSTGPS